MEAGQINFYTAASGTAGAALTWATTLTLNNAQNATFAGDVTLSSSITGGAYVDGDIVAGIIIDSGVFRSIIAAAGKFVSYLCTTISMSHH